MANPIYKVSATPSRKVGSSVDVRLPRSRIMVTVEVVSSWYDIEYCQFNKDYSTLSSRPFRVVATGRGYKRIDGAIEALRLLRGEG